MSTDKDAMRERAREWFGEYGQLVCYGHRPDHETDYDPSRCAGCVDSLAALLAAEREDAVAEERERAYSYGYYAAKVEVYGTLANIYEAEKKRAATSFEAFAPSTTPTPSPSGEQPGEGENQKLVTFANEIASLCRVTHLTPAQIVQSIEVRALEAALFPQDEKRARQPRADYDAGESGEKI